MIGRDEGQYPPTHGDIRQRRSIPRAPFSKRKRPDVWEQETHWGALWEDVQTVMDQLAYAEQVAANAPAGSPPISTAPHFLGAIVLDQQMHDTGSLEVRYVIDGQQRLTTLQLFLSAAAGRHTHG